MSNRTLETPLATAAPATESPTTLAPAPVDTSTAVFPYASGDVRYDDPVEAARGFGRCFAITIHPYLLAWGGRLGLLEDVLARATSEPRAWNATASACARWFTAAYPAATSLRLDPSVWTDHPGSLS